MAGDCASFPVLRTPTPAPGCTGDGASPSPLPLPLLLPGLAGSAPGLTPPAPFRLEPIVLDALPFKPALLLALPVVLGMLALATEPDPIINTASVSRAPEGARLLVSPCVGGSTRMEEPLIAAFGSVAPLCPWLVPETNKSVAKAAYNLLSVLAFC